METRNIKFKMNVQRFQMQKYLNFVLLHFVYTFYRRKASNVSPNELLEGIFYAAVLAFKTKELLL